MVMAIFCILSSRVPSMKSWWNLESLLQTLGHIFFIHHQISGSIKAMDEGTGSGSCGYFKFFILRWLFILPGKVYRKVTLSPNRWKHRVPLLSQQSHRSNGRHYMILCRSHLGSAEGFIFRLYPLVDQGAYKESPQLADWRILAESFLSV